MKIIRNPEFTAPVKVISPGEGGQREDQFKVRFRALTRSQEEEYDRSTAAGTDEFLRAVVIGWEGLKEDDGAPFSAPDIAAESIDDSHIASVSADKIVAGMMNARHLEVTELLRITDGSGALRRAGSGASGRACDGRHHR